MAESHPPPRTRLPRLAVAAAALAAAAGGVWYGFFRPAPPPAPPAAAADPPPPDPRLTFPTPFRNVKPEVKYVGDAACAGCHADIDRTYHQHPMGRSAALTARASPLEKYDPGANNPTAAQGFELRVERDGGRVRHMMAAPADLGLPPYAVTADVAIGSGARGRSYLTVEPGGAVWQTPASWFSHESKWDVSPGFRLPEAARRAIVPDCLFCHVDRVEPVPHAANRYRQPLLVGQPAIGCERCHGPGELHVAERTAGHAPEGIDTSVVNPRHLSQDLRLAVCQQCHLQGEERVARRGRDVFEYRPGLPLELFLTVFVRHPDLADLHKSVGQFEQMAASACFTRSGGKMDCASCHDPHEKPAADRADAFYRSRCLTCHESKGCSLPAPERRAKDDSCTACHMPRAASSNIAHTAVTDHRIPRAPLPAKPGGRAIDPGTPPLVPFGPGPHAPPPAERERDLGVALARLVGKVPAGVRAVHGVVGPHAERRLTAALETWPGDHDAWLGLAVVRARRTDDAGAAAAAEKAVALIPDSEAALAALAEAAVETDLDLAVRTADRLIALSPTTVAYRTVRAQAHYRKRDWAAAADDCRAALAVFPLDPSARTLLGACLHRQGDRAGGRKELDAALGLTRDPGLRAQLRDWYERTTR